ncbi:MAG: SUMF1/EgtB/PvdO family nonheme iron enzyme [Rhizobiaceae bacterium]|jgi:formylglycine-generating enzyme required for sulfatase activity
MHLTLVEAALGGALALVVPMTALGLSGRAHEPKPIVPAPDTIKVAASVIDYPLPGEFLDRGLPATAPTKRTEVPAFRITKQQVSLTDYDRCVAAGACIAADAQDMSADVPVTGVSWLDAEAYAGWLSKATGASWRLPTDAEMATAAAERFAGESFSAGADNPSNPAVRWIRQYRQEAAARRPADPGPKPRGHYGANSQGLEDFAGNVWEWTSTCYERVTLGGGGEHAGTTWNCGVHALEGRHRAYMSNFVREGKSGGCAVGTPPDYLGFRLVRERTSLAATITHRLLSILHPAHYNSI